MSNPIALILRTAGTNCDRELAFAFELAGAGTRTVHLHELIARPGILGEVDLVGFPGGFSYGDDIAAGRIQANLLRHRLLGPVQAAIARGVPMIGICNGFQVLVKAGLLPFPQEAKQVVTLADNTCGRFIDRWIGLRAEPASVCVWTKGLDRLDLPIAHGEGRFEPESAEVLERLKQGGQVALRYGRMVDGITGEYPPAEPEEPGVESEGAKEGDKTGTQHPSGCCVAPSQLPGANPNGSVEDIAGVCDPTGLVLGLMPHPERHVHGTHHPCWTRFSAQRLAQTPAGLRFFQNALEHVRQRAAVTV
ncbi:MAG: phosphoribosylformylglycinamidine synthase subunit PurQ [Phycisphaeraceae bacterium]|nr:phosphoribosylformylglycinamidine synthase subunit PurQ [Phycisphaeraceae bacterium]